MVLITDEMIEAAERNNVDLRMEVAVLLYSTEIYPLRKAAEVAGVSWLALTDEANKRGLSAWDAQTVEDFEEEWQRVRKAYFHK